MSTTRKSKRAQLEGREPADQRHYDLFGNGKTAVKASVSRSILQDSIGVARANDPAANALVTSTDRCGSTTTATDAGLRSVESGAAEFLRARLRSDAGFVRTVEQRQFRQSGAGDHLDSKILDGWGVRPYNWEYRSVSSMK
jgi:hypothetical protein